MVQAFTPSAEFNEFNRLSRIGSYGAAALYYGNWKAASMTRGIPREIEAVFGSTTWGQVIPYSWGIRRCVGRVVYAGQVRTTITPVTTYAQGKNNRATATSYHLDFVEESSLDLVYSFGYPGNPSAQRFLNKLWIDNELIIDRSTGFYSNKFSTIFYDGTQTAPDAALLADPTYEIGLRDLVYDDQMIVVVSGFDPIGERNRRTGRFTANALPQMIVAEIWENDVTPSIRTVFTGISTGYTFDPSFIAWGRRRLYQVATGARTPQYRIVELDTDTLEQARVLTVDAPFRYSPNAVTYIPWLHAFVSTGSIPDDTSGLYMNNADTGERIALYNNVYAGGGDPDARFNVTFGHTSTLVPPAKDIVPLLHPLTGETYIMLTPVVSSRQLGFVVYSPTTGGLSRGPIYTEASNYTNPFADNTRGRLYYFVGSSLKYVNPRETGLQTAIADATEGTGAPIFAMHDVFTDRIIVGYGLNKVRAYSAVDFAILWTVTLPTNINANHYRTVQSNTTAGTLGVGRSVDGADASIITLRNGGVQDFAGFAGSNGIWDSVAFRFIGYSVSGGEQFVSTLDVFDPEGRISLASWLKDVGVLLGYDRDNVVTTGITDTFIGAYLAEDYGGDEILDDVCQLYGIDRVESAGTLRFFKRGRGASLSVDIALNIGELALLDESKDNEHSALRVTRSANVEAAPRLIRVWYIDYDADFTFIPYEYTRPDATSNATGELELKVPIVTTRSEIAALVVAMIYDAWGARTQFEFRLPAQYSRAEPGDVVEITGAQYVDTIRVTNTIRNGDWTTSCTGVGVVQEAAPVPAGVNNRFTPISRVLTGLRATFPVVVDGPNLPGAGSVVYGQEGEGSQIPIIVDAIPAAGNADWPGGLVYRVDDGTRRTVTARVGLVAAGRLTSALPIGAPQATDTVNSIRVRAPNAALFTTITEASQLSGGNMCIVGVPGAWEYVNYRTATDNGDGTVTLSTLIRAWYGTDTIAAPHPVGSVCYLLPSDYALLRDNTDRLTLEKLGEIIPYFGLGQGELSGSIAGQNVAIEGAYYKPPAPADVRATFDGGDVNLTWQRRDRFGWNDDGFSDGTETLPLSEAAEEYTLDIYNASGTIVRTVTGLASAAFTYTAAMQSADTNTITDTINVAVYQISAVVGRGFGQRKNVNVN